MRTGQFIHRSGLSVAWVCAALQAQPPAEPLSPQDPAAELAARLEAAPEDHRAATWMLDLAAIRLADAMRNCDDASVMFGLPTAEQFR